MLCCTSYFVFTMLMDILLFNYAATQTKTGSEKALYRYLMDDYEKGARPVIKHNTTVEVKIGVKLNQILDLNERIQVLTSIVAVDQTWRDEYLTWNPTDYDGIETMYIPCGNVWHPDIVLYNRVEGIHEDWFMNSPISVDYMGNVDWFPLAKLQTSCKLDIRFYPFDHQVCYLKLGSWSYSEKEVDVQDGGFTGIEKPDFVDNGEFELVKFQVERVENKYDCCPNPIITLNVNIHFRRRPMFSLFTIAIPCIMLSLMTIIAFILPPQNEAKIEVQLSVMLSLAVFMLMIGESLPPTSDKVPLIGVHIVIQMGLTALSLVCSVFVLRLVHTDYKDVPEVLRKRAIKLASVLCIGVPDYLKDKQKVTGKLAILEKHQLDLRKHYMTSTAENGLGPEGHNIKFSLKKISDNATRIATLAEEEDCETEPLVNNNKRVRRSQLPKCQCQAERYEINKLSISVAKILELMEDNILKDQRRAEWRMLGALIDRVLLIVLIIAATSTTLYIYVIAPVTNKVII